MTEKADLYGIKKSNRSPDDHWGKNRFNSSFPIALACWMRDNDYDSLLVQRAVGGGFKERPASIEEVFGTSLPNEEITFNFEHTYPPYRTLAYDEIKGIDVVLYGHRVPIRPLEIKLTVVPDSGTSKRPEAEWGPEMVIRPATTKFAALGVSFNTLESRSQSLEILDPICSTIQHWDNAYEITAQMPNLIDATNALLDRFADKQQPFLIQPLWKTKGQSPELADPTFDLLVWTDHAILQLALESARRASKEEPLRTGRACVRLARILWEIAKGQKTHMSRIYNEMAFSRQTDKEFALNGSVIRSIVESPRLSFPSIPREAIKEIILNQGYKKLKPERRFDQAISISATRLFED